MELLNLVRLEGLDRRYPSQLSGRQKRRCRREAGTWPFSRKSCCSTSPSAPWMPRCGKSCASWLQRLHHDEFNMTTVFVTHDQEEAMEVADRIVVMNQGRIEQSGSPAGGLRRHPANRFRDGLPGKCQRLSRAGGKRPGHAGHGGGRCRNIASRVAARHAHVRPHELDIPTPGDGAGSLKARVERIE